MRAPKTNLKVDPNSRRTSSETLSQLSRGTRVETLSDLGISWGPIVRKMSRATTSKLSDL